MGNADLRRRAHRTPGDRRTPDELFKIALEADLVEAFRVSPVAGALFSLRAQIERIVGLLIGRPPKPATAPSQRARLADMPDRGEWVSLGQEPPREIAFGAIGRLWGGETRWEEIDANDFAGFSRPGLARIAANLSFRGYGRDRTLVSYECRVQATDAGARRAFMRYWRPVSPLIGVVLRAVLTLIAQIERDRRDGAK